MHDHSSHPPSAPSPTYADEAAAADDLLDERLAEVRRDTDAGDITHAEAAELRCAALEEHIETTKRLRAVHFGQEEDTS